MANRAHSTAMHVLRRVAVGIVLVGVMALGGALLMHASVEIDQEAASDPDNAQRRLAISGVKSWGYQLQKTDLDVLAASPFDLLVIDPTAVSLPRPGGQEKALKALQNRQDLPNRVVLAYLSIGEAEDYRKYWKRDWVTALPPATAGSAEFAVSPATAEARRPNAVPTSGPDLRGPLRGPSQGAPSWLAEENAEWRGNYLVRFWDPLWQGLLYGDTNAALDQIIAAGFDGVYLDRADVYAALKAVRPSAEADMVELIGRISAYARRQNPNFLILLQNAEELLAHRRVRGFLDAVAKEDLLFGISGAGVPNAKTEIASSLHFLNSARTAGKPIFVVEYLTDRLKIADVRKWAAQEGFVLRIAPRDLGQLVPEPMD